MKRLLLILAATGMAAFVQADDWGSVVATGTSSSGSLDLSATWNIVHKADVKAIAYSSDGWEISPSSSGRTVSLVRIDGDTEVTIAEGLAGDGTYTWTLSGVQRKAYTVEHRVYTGASEVTDERLTASFDFTDCTEIVASDEDMISAVKAESQAFAVSNDKTNPWAPINLAGDGIAAPTGLSSDVGSTFAFSVVGKGRFSFVYRAAGAFAVWLDGVKEADLEAADGWTVSQVDTPAAGSHTIAFVLTGAGVGELKEASWICSEPYEEAAAVSTAFPVDLREGDVLTATEHWEVLPFVWSSTNFTGLAGTDAASIARVTVTPMAGAGEDVTDWEPLAAKAVVILETTGEGAVKWRPHRGVYEAKFEILADGDVVRVETRILDLRHYGKGLVITIN